MAFTYSTPIVSNLDTISGTDSQVRMAFLTAVETALTDATWSATDVFPTSTFTATFQPANNNTIVVGGKTYQYQTTLTNIDGNIQIGGSLADTISNTIVAVNLGAGAGTAYAAATTANTAAAATAGNITTAFRATGLGPSPYSNLGANVNCNGSQNCSYGGWSSATLTGAGQSFLSPENTDDFGQFIIKTRTNGLSTNQNIFLDIALRDDSVTLTDVGIFGGNVSNSPGLVSGNTYRMIASPSSFAIFLPGTFNSDGTTFFFNAPAVRAAMRGKKISTATNASPVVINTTAAHGYVTGQSVVTKYIGGNAGANTTGLITVLSPTSFSITGSVGDGAYTSGGIVWNTTLSEVGEFAVASGGASNGAIATWRSTLDQNRNAWIINGAAIDNGTSGRPAFMYQAINGGTATSGFNKWFNGDFFGIEPWVGAGVTTSGSVTLVGQMRNVVIGEVSTPGDTIPDPFDGHTWINITNSYTGTTNVAPGGLLWATS